MKKLLILIFIWMGVFILLRPVGEFKAGAIGNIIHRRNLVTGMITADNGDKSYAVEIEESGKSIKKIFTLSPDPDLAVGDKARVLYRGGNPEDRILLAPTKPAIPIAVTPLIAVIVQQYSEDDYLKFYDLNGNLQNSYLLGNGIIYFETDCMAMDNQNNVYYIKNSNYLTKIDSGGNELLSVVIAGSPESIAIGADGYLYTREQDGKVHKRSLSDFSSQGYITLTSEKSYFGLVLDENNNIFTVNDTDEIIEKWSSVGIKVASRSITEGWSSSLCLAPNENYILRVRNGYNSEVFIIKKDLSANEQNYYLPHIDGYPHATSSVGSMYLFTGENNEYNCELEVHKWGGVEWYAIVDDSQYSPDNSLVAAYPF